VTGIAADIGGRLAPEGTLTFLISDFEDGARVWDAIPEAMAQAAGIQREIVSRAAARSGGEVLHRYVAGSAAAGPAAVAVFRRAPDALTCALEVQRAAPAQEWPSSLELSVRVALHSAEIGVGLERNHAGVALRRCSHLCAIARGGQILLCRATRELVVSRLPGGVELVDLGVHRLSDLGRAERVYALLEGEPSGAVGGLRSLDTLPNNLPGELTTFVGRERELAELWGVLRNARLLTLTGAGGCGKTRLALQAAANALDRWPGGVWWVDLAPVTDQVTLGQALTEALGVRPVPGHSALKAAVAHLSTRRALVLLDNCEHVLDDAAEAVQALLKGCPEATILVTSRAPLDLPAETTWRVPSLSLPDPEASESLRAVAESDAARLFIERATKVRPDFTVTDATAPALAEICSKLDGIPLAIELAAARVRLMSVEQLAQGLSDRFRLLTGGDRTALPRHRTLRASMEWSHDLLSDDERTLLRRLGVFVGGFTLEAAEQVCALDDAAPTGIIDVLASLVAKSLVIGEERGPAMRYRMLQTVREYALERLREADEVATIRDRHRDFFLALAERTAPELLTRDVQSRLDVLDTELPNLNLALGWAIETDGERALRLCVALSFWWRMHGVYAAADATVCRALDAAERTPSSLRARGLWTLASLRTRGGRYREALDAARDALAVAEEVDDASAMAWAIDAIGRIRFGSDPIGFRPLQERGLELARASGEEFCRLSIAQNIALGHAVCGEYDVAERMFDAIRPTIEQRGYPEVVASNWLGMAHGPEAMGDAERFFERTERAIEAAREVRDSAAEGTTHAHMAMFELAQGRVDEAAERLEASRERVLARGAGVALVSTEYMLAAVQATRGDLDGARSRLEALLARDIGRGVHFAWTAAQLADVLRVAGDRDGSEEWARRALEVAERIQSPHASWCMEILGRLAAARASWSEAERLLHDSLAKRSRLKLRRWLPQTLDALAEVAAGLSNYGKAARLLGAAERGRSDLGLVRWAPDEPRFEALARDLRMEMGDEAFRAAWSEGTRLGLEGAVGWISRARGPRKRPPAGWESLTPTELEVARHAAAGLLNLEIGKAMFVSRGTVKTHLSHIYAKLGLRNRAELTAEATRRLQADSPESAGSPPSP
jgi:predicted ATPase/DNA-binding CsgD family transcriptional regulator